MTPVGSTDAPLITDEVAEKSLLAIGLTLVMVAGGIDLSIGSIVGFSSLGALTAFRVWGWPMELVIPGAVIVGAMLGAINGFLIANLKMRPFITTLVTLVAFGGAADALQSSYTDQLGFPKPDILWDFLSEGAIAGLPTAWVIFGVVLVVAHLGLTRSRWGWWVTAVGSDRRSARRNGIPVDRVVFFTYVVSGALAGLAGLLTAARLGRTDPTVGEGWELIALTAVVIGGVSLKGGRGSVVRAVVGVVVVIVILQASIASQMEAGGYTAILAIVLFLFAVLDLKWGKYRLRIAEKLTIDPGRISVGPLVDVTEPGSVWSINSRLTDAPPIGLGKIEGAEDCALDDEGNLFCGDRRGWIWRFRGPDHTSGEVFARTGGMPLGHAWDRDGVLMVAVGGMGVYRVFPDGGTELVANQVRRSWTSLHDDSALRFADDLDTAPDGSIYVSDFSTRTNAAEYMVELVEYRPNGRVIRIDPDGGTDVVVSNYVFPNGISTAHDGQSILIAST
ncbi:MAG: ABC transporter permease, partial [Actinomycetota bacterium]